MATDPNPQASAIRFGDFEIDVRSHELRRSGRRIHLQEKSFLVLNELLKEPGRVVSREALAAKLWPKELYVDAEHGLNTAVRRLREALGDSAEEPRYVETLPRLGYRFIAPVTQPPSPPDSPDARPHETPRRMTQRRGLIAAVLVVAAALAVLAGFSLRSPARSTPPATVETSSTVQELLSRANYLRNHKRFAEAKQFIEEALKLDPKNPDAIAGMAMNFMIEGNYQAGREAAHRALELDPDAPVALRVLANLAYRGGDYIGAERYFRRAVETNPDDAKSQNRLARHFLETGKVEDAHAHMLESRRLAPDDPDVQDIWIEYELLTGDYESAIRESRIWLTIWEKQYQPESVTAVRQMLGLAYVGARRVDDAIALYRSMDADDQLHVALALGHAGRRDEARAILNAQAPPGVGVNSPHLTDPADAAAMAWIAIGDFDRAFEQLGRQVAARKYPTWLHLPMFHGIRKDPRWPAFDERLQREFFSGKNAPPSRPGEIRPWPLPPRAPDTRAGS